jgi:hypothetical protein
MSGMSADVAQRKRELLARLDAGGDMGGPMGGPEPAALAQAAEPTGPGRARFGAVPIEGGGAAAAAAAFPPAPSPGDNQAAAGNVPANMARRVTRRIANQRNSGKAPGAK